MVRIAVVAPSCTFSREAAELVQAIASARGGCELVIHRQCFRSDGHFAGTDEERLAAFQEVSADPSFDAIWFARGGYGSNRIAEDAVRDLPEAARTKLYLGYSDGGFMLSALHRAGLEVAHAPMPQDVLREGGAEAVARALDWIVDRNPATVEPHLNGPALAFNLTVLSCLLGTPLEPDFDGRELLVEEVSEHHYRIDRLMFHITSNAAVRRVSSIRVGRVSDVPVNDPAFGSDELAIVEHWCRKSGIRFGGTADIGHDAANKVVPFGIATS